MSTQKSNQNLIWVDLEMTGLDPDKEENYRNRYYYHR
jgi:oligoribonuclease (3'-5' exoribonuclease)